MHLVEVVRYDVAVVGVVEAVVVVAVVVAGKIGFVS